MEYQNVSHDLTQEELDAIKADITALNEKVSSFAVDLSVKERRRLQTMGDRSHAFVEKALAYSTEYPEFAPNFFDAREFQIDFDLSVKLREVQNSLGRVIESIEDTRMAAGADAFAHARQYYDGAKNAVKASRAGADAVVADLKKMYDRRKLLTTDEENPPAEPTA